MFDLQVTKSDTRLKRSVSQAIGPSSPVTGTIDKGSHITLNICITLKWMLQPSSGITNDSLLNGELYTQRFQELIYLRLFTRCFMKISLRSIDCLF